MPRFEITAPDGKRYEISGPEGATADQALQHFQSQWKPAPAPMQPQPGDMEMLRGLGQGDFAPQGPQRPQPASWENRPTPRSVIDRGAEELKRLGIGFERGVTDAVAGTTQLGAHILPGVSSATAQVVDRAVADRGAGIAQDRLQQAQGDRADAQARAAYGEPGYILRGVQQDEQGRASHTVEPFGIPSGQPGFDVGRMAGNIAGTLPAAAAGPVAGAVIGSTMMPVESGGFWGEKGKQALTGLVTGGAAKVVGGLAAPQVSADARTVAQAGARPTMGQLGLIDKMTEDKWTSLPFTGGIVARGQRAGVETFDRGVVNKAVSPLGITLPDNIPAGREAVKWAGDQVGKVYDDVIPKTAFTPDAQFLSDVQTALSPITPYLKGDGLERLKNIVGERVTHRIQQAGGTLTGDLAKEVQSELGNFVRTAAKSSDGAEQALGEAVGAFKDALSSGIARQNPQYAEALKNADRAWAMLVRVEGAAGNRSTSGGVFTPGDLLTAAKRNDATVRHRGFARGDALMQDLGEAGQATIGNRYPDSGTGGRIGQTSSVAWGVGAAASPVAKMLYSAPARGFMAEWATPGPAREALANALRRGAPVVSPGVGGSLAREKELEALARQLLGTQ